jgi:beta-lactamase superfamily II metal-dependent hydrolase
MDRLTIYAYNVFFGDGILIEVPDAGKKRYILIDVGNVLTGAPGADPPLLTTVQDIKKKTGGHIDLYIMTHEHLDHVQGLLYAKSLGCELTFGHVWMSACSAPGYYESHPDAHLKKKRLEETVAAFVQNFGAAGLPEDIAAIHQLNAAPETKDYVDYLKGLNPPNTHFLSRGSDITGMHPFKSVKFRILAPEEDTSVYYGSSGKHLGDTGPQVAYSPAARPLPLPGVDGGAFYNLIDRMNSGLVESLFTIDQAANNTSLVVEIEWRGRKLLFVGDAEQKSWAFMAKNKDLQAVDFLKVGHHGSINATPPAPILEMVLPAARHSKALALVSTCPCAWKSVPSDTALNAVASRVRRLYDTRAVAPGSPVAIRFSGAT